MRIPRYLPRLDWAAWLAPRTGLDSPTEPAAQLRHTLGIPGDVVRNVSAFRRLRVGLAWYLRDRAVATGKSTVLLGAHSCAALPQAVVAAGLRVRWVDAGEIYPMPSSERYRFAMTDDVCAVIVAPLYGLFDDSWLNLPRVLPPDVSLVLDCAQYPRALSGSGALMRRANAICYSFGAGKGVDSGGSVMFHDANGAAAPGILCKGDRIFLAAALTVVLVRLAWWVRLYDRLVARAESADEPGWQLTAYSPCPQLLGYWRAGLVRVQSELRLARARARALAESIEASRLFKHWQCYGNDAHGYLRYVCRFERAAHRNWFLDRIRGYGIDCDIAGEPGSEAFVVEGARDLYPNAVEFLGDSLRLPYFGRLSEPEFSHLKRAFFQTCHECVSAGV